MKYSSNGLIAEAVEWDGDNTKEMTELCAEAIAVNTAGSIITVESSFVLTVRNGKVRVYPGDYVARIGGDFYAFPGALFETYFDQLIEPEQTRFGPVEDAQQLVEELDEQGEDVGPLIEKEPTGGIHGEGQEGGAES